MNELRDYDNLVRESIALIIGCALDDRAMLQCSLPIAKSGLGFQCLANVVVVAFAASVAQSYNVLKESTRAGLKEVEHIYLDVSGVQTVDFMAIETLSNLSHPQKVLTAPITMKLVTTYVDTITNSKDSEKLLAHWNSVKDNPSNTAPPPVETKN